jgi:hypothetical protein
MAVRLRLNNAKCVSYCMLILNCAVAVGTVARCSLTCQHLAALLSRCEVQTSCKQADVLSDVCTRGPALCRQHNVPHQAPTLLHGVWGADINMKRLCFCVLFYVFIAHHTTVVFWPCPAQCTGPGVEGRVLAWHKTPVRPVGRSVCLYSFIMYRAVVAFSCSHMKYLSVPKQSLERVSPT